MYKNIHLVLAFCLCFISCGSTKNNKTPNNILPATSLQPYGRYLVSDRQNIELISSGVHFGFTFEGKQCQIFASISNTEDHNYLQYELDGVYQKRIKVTGNSQIPIVLNASNTGNLSLIHISEPTRRTP